MEKLTKAIEFFATTLMAYPKWAQGLFIITTCMFALSITVFLILLPSAKKKLDTTRGPDTPPPSSPWVVTKPQSGEFITTRRLTIHGKGAKPTDNNSLEVKVTYALTGTSWIAQGRFVVNSDQTWRFEDVELQQAGSYDLVIDAIFGGTRASTILRINYEPRHPNPSPSAVNESQRVEVKQKSEEGADRDGALSLPYTFFLLNDDMELNRNWQFLI